MTGLAQDYDRASAFERLHPDSIEAVMRTGPGS